MWQLIEKIMREALDIFRPPSFGLQLAGVPMNCPPTPREEDLFSIFKLKGDVAAPAPAPSPDPRLVEQQIKSMGVQDQLTQEIIKNAKEYAPLQAEQTQQAIDAVKLGQEQSLADRAYALERRGQLTSLQDSQIKDAAAFNEQGKAKQLAAQASADVGMAFEQKQQEQNRALARAGVAPGSGKALALMSQTGLAEAATKAGAANTATRQARTEGYALTDRAANSLSGYPNMGLTTTNQGATLGSAGQAIANTGLNGANSGYVAGGTMAGQTAATATNMFNAQANYKSNIENINLKNSGSDLSGLGSVMGGAAAMGLRFSDKRLKRNIVKIANDSRGFGVYEFSYLWSRKRHIGVLAQEVEKVLPAAVSSRFGFKTVNYAML
jgi:hypothetical protein